MLSLAEVACSVGHFSKPRTTFECLPHLNSKSYGSSNSSPIQVSFEVLYGSNIADASQVRGDCGAWIIDSSNEILYGHLVAGDTQNGFSYIIPACNTAADIESQYGATPSFLLPRRLAASPSGVGPVTVAEAAKPFLATILTVPTHHPRAQSTSPLEHKLLTELEDGFSPLRNHLLQLLFVLSSQDQPQALDSVAFDLLSSQMGFWRRTAIILSFLKIFILIMISGTGYLRFSTSLTNLHGLGLDVPNLASPGMSFMFSRALLGLRIALSNYRLIDRNKRDDLEKGGGKSAPILDRYDERTLDIARIPWFLFFEDVSLFSPSQHWKIFDDMRRVLATAHSIQASIYDAQAWRPINLEPHEFVLLDSWICLPARDIMLVMATRTDSLQKVRKQIAACHDRPVHKSLTRQRHRNFHINPTILAAVLSHINASVIDDKSAVRKSISHHRVEMTCRHVSRICTFLKQF